MEFAAAHINVNMICPGVFLTPVMEMQERADTMTNGTITAGIVGASGFAGALLASRIFTAPRRATVRRQLGVIRSQAHRQTLPRVRTELQFCGNEDEPMIVSAAG